MEDTVQVLYDPAHGPQQAGSRPQGLRSVNPGLREGHHRPDTLYILIDHLQKCFLAFETWLITNGKTLYVFRI